MAIYARPYRDEQDYQCMRQLLMSIYALSGPPSYCTLGDLDWWRFGDSDPEVVRCAHLWFDESYGLIAFAWPSDDQVDLIAHPHYRSVDDALLAWAEANQRGTHGSETTVPIVRAWSFTGDAARNTILQQRGYTRTNDFLLFLVRRLDAPVPAPELPAGYTIRHINADEDVEQRVAVQRAAFGTTFMTSAKYQAIIRAPTYRPELDLVAVAPDGDFAAFALVWFDPANRLGLFEPVGCHPNHRNRGLGTALLREGLRRLELLDGRDACVNASGGNAPAARLYAASGFVEVDRNYAWIKQVGNQ